MEKITTIILLTGLAVLLSCANVSAKRRPGRRDYCQLASDQGRCRASITKWFYDSSSGECKNFTWGGCGGNSNKFSTKSFCERVCKPSTCRQERCRRTCLNGFIIDSSGCNTCRCQPGAEEASCPSIECDNRCPHGFARDTQGCMTCDCEREPPQAQVKRTSRQHQCPPVCYMFCQFGNKQDENGCDICACKRKEEVCGAQQCMMECPTGFVTDSRGCELCECKSASEAGTSCPVNQCFKECAYGFQKDSLGCEICECATRRHGFRPFSTTDCSNRPSCSMICPNGFLKGRDGCDICKCASRSHTRHLGRTDRHNSGKGASEEDVCGVAPMCTLYCPQGFQKDSRGCNTCFCRQDPPPQAAQLPVVNAANFPAQLPANIPSQLPAQIPVNVPAPLPASRPADVPSQLPAGTDCTPKKCHKYASCSFGFVKDAFGCDTCVCDNAGRRTVSARRSFQ